MEDTNRWYAPLRFKSPPGNHAARLAQTVAIVFLWALSLGLIWLYEPSSSGTPNILVFPLLASQVGLFWSASRILRKLSPPARPGPA
jgi:hypothetical protein